MAQRLGAVLLALTVVRTSAVEAACDQGFACKSDSETNGKALLQKAKSTTSLSGPKEAHEHDKEYALPDPNMTPASQNGAIQLSRQDKLIKDDWVCAGQPTGDPRSGDTGQIARRCLPAFEDDQEVEMYLLIDDMGGGVLHLGLGYKSHCDGPAEIAWNITTGLDTKPASRIPNLPDGERTDDAKKCADLCQSNMPACAAFVFADDAADGEANCFPLSAANCCEPNEQRTYGQPLKTGCVTAMGDLGFGAWHFSLENSLPKDIDVNAGTVTFDEEALEVSFQINNPYATTWPSFWTAATGIGKLTGAQANALFDWATVPDHNADGSERAVLSGIQDGDNNYVSLAGQYNLIGAGAPTRIWRDAGLQYLSSTTCGDFVWSALRFLSASFGVTLKPYKNAPACLGDGCDKATKMTHTPGNLEVWSGAPSLIGDGSVAGKDCAQFWDLLKNAAIPIINNGGKIDWSAVLKAFADYTTGGYASKACVYKNHKWYKFQAPYNAMWAFSGGTDAYECKRSWLCASDQCSFGGECLTETEFWSPAPLKISSTASEYPPAPGHITLDNESIQTSIGAIVDELGQQGFEGQYYYLMNLAVPLGDQTKSPEAVVGDTKKWKLSFRDLWSIWRTR